jgi:hypothetical protein
MSLQLLVPDFVAQVMEVTGAARAEQVSGPCLSSFRCREGLLELVAACGGQTQDPTISLEPKRSRK